MNKSYLVIGSGLSALGSIKALNRIGIVPDVYDTSIEINRNLKEIKDRLKVLKLEHWSKSDVSKTLVNFEKTKNIFSIPRKNFLGSNFFYGKSQAKNDIHSDGIHPPFSFALGGLAEGWGAAFLPPAKEDLKEWIYSHEEILKNFKEILKHMHVSGEKDELDEIFPIMKDNLHELDYTSESLELLKGLKKSTKDSSVLVGKSRLLLNPMTSKFKEYCYHSSEPKSNNDVFEKHKMEMQRDWFWQIHDAIYKPSLEIKSLSEKNKISFYSGRRVTDVVINSDQTLSVNYIDSSDKKFKSIRYNKIFLAAGCVNTSRIILNSKKLFNKKLKVQTRGGFIIPAFSFKKINPSSKLKNTMPNFFIEILTNHFPNWIHIQVSLQNELFENRLSRIGKWMPLKSFINFIKERIFIVFVNLNSNEAGHYELFIDSKNNSIYGPRLNTIYKKKPIKLIKKFNFIFQVFLIFAKAKVFLTPFTKSNEGTYHVGGSFPMRKQPLEWNETNYLGELSDMKNLHLVDSSTFPTLPSTTIGLLSKVMAFSVTEKALTRDQNLSQ